ncbi:hypothetical protein EHZ64_04110, partial [Aeromonas enteropelogenes]
MHRVVEAVPVGAEEEVVVVEVGESHPDERMGQRHA